MTLAKLEQRVTALENQIKSLTGRSSGPSTNKDWLLKIWGSFKDDPAFDQAMNYGRQWRKAQRPGKSKSSHSGPSR